MARRRASAASAYRDSPISCTAVLFKATASDRAETAFESASVVGFVSVGLVIADNFGSEFVFDAGGAAAFSRTDFFSPAGSVSGGAVTIFAGDSMAAALSVAGIVTGGAATLSVAGFESELVVVGASVLTSASFVIGCFAFGLAGGGAETGAGSGSAFDPEAGLPFAFSVGTVAGASFEVAGFASTAAGSTDFSLGMTGLDSAGDVDAVVDVSGGG